MKKRVLSFSLIAALALSLCSGAALATEGRASTTIKLYTASASKGDSAGEVKISYEVQAKSLADEVGISSIVIYKSDGTYVTTITGSVSNGLIRTSTTRHRSTYTYSGNAGTSYYAIVTGFATIGSDSDSKSVKTNAV